MNKILELPFVVYYIDHLTVINRDQASLGWNVGAATSSGWGYIYLCRILFIPLRGEPEAETRDAQHRRTVGAAGVGCRYRCESTRIGIA
jgi:hypothetical protein